MSRTIFTVRQYRDAYHIYEADIEAETPEEAIRLAAADRCTWQDAGVSDLDDRHLEITDEDGTILASREDA